MIFVNSFNPGCSRRGCAPQPQIEELSLNGMPRHGQVSNHYRGGVVFKGYPRVHGRMSTLDLQKLSAQSVEQLECAIGRFGDPMQIQQANPAVKRHEWKRGLRENVGEGPKAVTLDQA